MAIRLAVDAMGGDGAPGIVIGGAALALKKHSSLLFDFYGPEGKLSPLLALYPELKSCAQIIHTDQYIPNDMKPSAALRQAKSSSMRLALESTRDGKTDATVSAGNTGAYMALSKMVLRTLPGISRPAIGGVMPTRNGRGSVMLDLGANVDSSAENLVQFAVMGYLFAQDVLKIENPSVALLNIGSEDVKGSPAIQEAHQLLRNSKKLDYRGFIEGHELMRGDVNVIVADGFSGNIAIKTAEGTAIYIKSALQEAFSSSFWTKLGYLLVKPVFSKFRDKHDTRKLNGAPFLGLDGIAVKSHGGADEIAFAAAIGVAVDMAQRKINDHIRQELEKWQIESNAMVESVNGV